MKFSRRLRLDPSMAEADTHQPQGLWCQSTGSQCCCSKCPDSPRWFPGNQFRLQGFTAALSNNQDFKKGRNKCFLYSGPLLLCHFWPFSYKNCNRINYLFFDSKQHFKTIMTKSIRIQKLSFCLFYNHDHCSGQVCSRLAEILRQRASAHCWVRSLRGNSVSYTHLTLPTILLV